MVTRLPEYSPEVARIMAEAERERAARQQQAATPKPAPPPPPPIPKAMLEAVADAMGELERALLARVDRLEQRLAELEHKAIMAEVERAEAELNERAVEANRT